MNSSSWSWSSSSSSCQSGTTSTKIVQTTIINGKKVVTTKYNEQPQTISFGETKVPSQCIMSKHPPSAQKQTSAAPNKEPAPASGSKGSVVSFEQQSLDEHNRLRALHGCPPLKLNQTLCAYSAEWAKHLADRKTLEHRTEKKYGENLFMAGGYTVDGQIAVKNWYDEMKLYNFSKPGFKSGTGHFTQVIWKNSKELGVAVERRGNSTWVVANYDPPGNFLSDYESNVPRPIK